MKKKPPKPTGLKVDTPPKPKILPQTSFQQAPETKKPTFEDKHPVAAQFFHIFMMTAFGILCGVGFIVFLFFRRHHSTSSLFADHPILLLLVGAIGGIGLFIKFTKK